MYRTASTSRMTSHFFAPDYIYFFQSGHHACQVPGMYELGEPRCCQIGWLPTPHEWKVRPFLSFFCSRDKTDTNQKVPDNTPKRHRVTCLKKRARSPFVCVRTLMSCKYGGNPENKNENEPLKKSEKKKRRLLSCNYLPPDWNTLSRWKILCRTADLFSASYAVYPPLSRPTRHWFGPANIASLSASGPRREPRVKPGDQRGPCSPARQCWCSDCGALFEKFCLGQKNKHRLSIVWRVHTCTSYPVPHKDSR